MSQEPNPERTREVSEAAMGAATQIYMAIYALPLSAAEGSSEAAEFARIIQCAIDKHTRADKHGCDSVDPQWRIKTIEALVSQGFTAEEADQIVAKP